MSRLLIASYREAEVKCFHCGCDAGLLRQEQGVPGAPTEFQDVRGGPPRTIKSLASVRCARCGGSLYTEEFEVRHVYPQLDEVDRPRRGRPPKWLVEARRAREAALESA